MGTRSSEQLRVSPPQTGYLLEGGVLEARPRPGLRGPGSDRPGPSVAAWRIRRGHINGVDVSRQVVLVLSTGAREAPDESVARLILLDEKGTPEQVLALLDAFRGKLGGPLADLAPSVAEEMGFFQVPITWRLDGKRGVVSVPHRFRLVVPIEPAGASHAPEIWVNLAEQGLVDEGDDFAGAYRQFRFAQTTTRTR